MSDESEIRLTSSCTNLHCNGWEYVTVLCAISLVVTDKGRESGPGDKNTFTRYQTSQLKERGNNSDETGRRRHGIMAASKK